MSVLSLALVQVLLPMLRQDLKSSCEQRALAACDILLLVLREGLASTQVLCADLLLQTGWNFHGNIAVYFLLTRKESASWAVDSFWQAICHALTSKSCIADAIDEKVQNPMPASLANLCIITCQVLVLTAAWIDLSCWVF